VLRGYSKAAPHFLLWGVIWAVGYAGAELLPARAGLLWLACDAIGITGSFLLVRVNSSPGEVPVWGARSRQSINFFVIALAFVAFMGATYYVMQPHSSVQYAAFPPLVMALLYTVIGTLAGTRWIAIGVALAALTVVGYALLREHFMLWMALVGGSALLLTGAWMRRV
jgi:hypothetical protein